MFQKINICLQKFCLISMLFVLGKRASVNIVTSTDLTYLWNKFGQVSLIDRWTRKKSKLLTQGLVFKELFVR